MSAYLDASVLVPLFLNEPHSAAAKNWIIASRHRLFYSHFAHGELNSAISRNMRMGVLDDDQADTIRSAASKWLKASILCNEIEDEDIAAAAKLVEIPRPKLLMPDAIHIALCRRSNHALVTFDKDLLTIAVREGVTAIYPV